jgi:hypothetical protein
MKRLRLLALLVLTTLPARGSASGLEAPIAAGLSISDPTHHARVDVYEDRRTVVQVDTRVDGVISAFDPIFDADSGLAAGSGPLLGRLGKEGKIVAIRFATPAEIDDFPHTQRDHFFVLTYSSGDVVVLDGRGSFAVKPTHCDHTGTYVVFHNIACKFDLDKAREDFDNAFQHAMLMTGPQLPANQPLSFAVPGSDITLHVAADRRIVSALDSSGRQIWTEDPFDAAGMRPYRFARPFIVRIAPLPARSEKECGARGKPFAKIGYNSSQFGCLDARTGRFEFLGQD